MKPVFYNKVGDILQTNVTRCLCSLQLQIISLQSKCIFIQVISAHSQTYLIHYFYFSIYKVIYITMTQNLLLSISDKHTLSFSLIKYVYRTIIW